MVDTPAVPRTSQNPDTPGDLRPGTGDSCHGRTRAHHHIIGGPRSNDPRQDVITTK
ncbi:hypothetical protein B005_5375 [Nocardiopsis alba ATCC BAA-2165]|uniref:Uncharacterized protein n=1 Tax=Nocardiopsis alba (strain ATCC BAA-2165 / BE74) TaxID=1205910 RepID=J7L4V1_NOCAA|nr:hypothetical protein B005_5375 [Nocardiopsis alba ATCC BAA-2165]